ncbi:MAG: hypothetical protein Q4C13_06000 [Clostridia bacterium]|nr:hypothetical protein [Clostridia bacterium]
MRRPASRMGAGASSILLIIVVVCLTLFGVLAFVTARNDAALTGRMMDGAARYYAADEAAQRAIMAVDDWLAAGRAGEPAGVTLTEEADGSLSFSVAADETHTLFVTLGVEAGRCRILRYSYENTAEWSADTAQELFS